MHQHLHPFTPSSWFVVIVCHSNASYLLTPSGCDVQVAPFTASTASSAWSTARQSCTRSGPSSSDSQLCLANYLDWIFLAYCILYVCIFTLHQETIETTYAKINTMRKTDPKPIFIKHTSKQKVEITKGPLLPEGWIHVLAFHSHHVFTVSSCCW